LLLLLLSLSDAADENVHKVPEGVDDLDAVLLTDILPTAWCALNTCIQCLLIRLQCSTVRLKCLDALTGFAGCVRNQRHCQESDAATARADCCRDIGGIMLLLLTAALLTGMPMRWGRLAQEMLWPSGEQVQVGRQASLAAVTFGALCCS
jgi:hypothetical protein